jgi:hypothetical protein
MGQKNKMVEKTKGQLAGGHLDALDNGFILYQEFENGEKKFMIASGNSYEIKGWGSALGTPDDHLLHMIRHPEEWKIFPNFNMSQDEYPYPWSSKWKKNL